MLVNIKDLKPHPRNNEFFPKMEGSKWDEFKEDIVTHGLRHPIVCTEDYVVIDGCERLRAHEELKIEQIEVSVKNYEGNNDLILYDLLASNLMRRGNNGCSPMQTASIVNEWSRLRKRWKSGELDCPTLSGDMPRIDIVLGKDKGTCSDYARLLKLTPEWKELVENKQSFRAISRLVADLPQEEQELLYDMLPNKKFTSAELSNLRKQLDEQKAIIEDQAECIRKYELDEDETSDRFEEVVQKCAHLLEEVDYWKERFAANNKDNGDYVEISKIQQERDEAIMKLDRFKLKEHGHNDKSLDKEGAIMSDETVELFLKDISSMISFVAMVKQNKKLKDGCSEVARSIADKLYAMIEDRPF